MKKYLTVSLVIITVAALALGIVNFFRPTPEITNITQGPVGAVPGSEIQGSLFTVGGVTEVFAKTDLTHASTTLCRIKNPLGATSTLVFASVVLNTGSTTNAVLIDIAKTTNTLSYATTTKIGSSYALAANTAVNIIASTSPAVGTVTTFDPNDWFVVKMDNGGAATANVPKGACIVKFMGLK